MTKPYQHGKKLWFWYRNPITKKQKNEPTPFAPGQETDAQKYIDTFLADLRAGVPSTGLVTVAQFASRWLMRRTTKTVGDDRTRITKHVLSRSIGSMPLTAVKPRHIDDVIEELKAEGKLAPRSIRNICGTLYSMFKRAVKEELITVNPVQMERGTLPKLADKDPTWRQEAIYTREEAELLISHPSILPDRRILYALKFLGGGMRHGEASRLTWRQYDAEAKPLGALNLGKTKSGVPRQIPVHPTLAKILAQWKLSGWEETYGRKPEADDLIVPTRNMTACKPTESQWSLIRDLKLLGLRFKAGKKNHRRGHDLRRTFVTLARSDGAHDGLLRLITHGPSASMLDLYSTPPWAALCAEVSKLKVELREGQMIALSPEALTSALHRERMANKRWRKQSGTSDGKATPTGFEPVLPRASLSSSMRATRLGDDRVARCVSS
ncbi:MAG: Mx8p12A [Myxococcales bacterium]|nr:Mx8p12A [Myxococcales bacterium]